MEHDSDVFLHLKAAAELAIRRGLISRTPQGPDDPVSEDWPDGLYATFSNYFLGWAESAFWDVSKQIADEEGVDNGA